MNSLYTSYIDLIGTTGLNILTLDIKCVLVDTADYTVNLTTDAFLTDIPAAARVSTSSNMTGKTFAAGIADWDDFVFTGASGDESEALVYYYDSGVEATSSLILYLDSASGLAVIPNTGDISVTINAAGAYSIP
jgi:hypothetical protein